MAEEEDKIAMPNWQTTLQDTLKGAGPQLMQAAQGGASGQDMLKQLGYKFGAKMLGTAIGGPVGTILGGLFEDGTTDVPDTRYGADPFPKGYFDGTPSVPHGYMGGTPKVPQRAPMMGPLMYQRGTDTVPAMLTPGEAVIPAPAAQDPANKQAIAGMVQQGRMMNDGKPAPSPMESQGSMPGQGPLSGKTKREQMKLMQDMSLKKKSWMADEKRKQEAHDQKMALDRQRASQAMRQSQE